MQKYFVTYKQALALKELGFDESCLAYWNISPHLKNPAFIIAKPLKHEWCLSAPLKSQVFEWFREKHKFHATYGTTNHYKEKVNGYCISNFIDSKRNLLHIKWKVGTYEEAESACIDKLIELVKKEKHAMY